MAGAGLCARELLARACVAGRACQVELSERRGGGCGAAARGEVGAASGGCFAPRRALCCAGCVSFSLIPSDNVFKRALRVAALRLILLLVLMIIIFIVVIILVVSVAVVGAKQAAAEAHALRVRRRCQRVCKQVLCCVRGTRAFGRLAARSVAAPAAA
jgi:hypothetical protein